MVNCPLSTRIWTHFTTLFNAPIPTTLSDAWSLWVTQGAFSPKPLGNLLVRAISWSIWIECNNHILFHVSLDVFSVICKVDHLLIAWISAASDQARPQLEETLHMVKRSLIFVGNRASTPLETSNLANGPSSPTLETTTPMIETDVPTLEMIALVVEPDDPTLDDAPAF